MSSCLKRGGKEGGQAAEVDKALDLNKVRVAKGEGIGSQGTMALPPGSVGAAGEDG